MTTISNGLIRKVPLPQGIAVAREKGIGQALFIGFTTAARTLRKFMRWVKARKRVAKENPRCMVTSHCCKEGQNQRQEVKAARKLAGMKKSFLKEV
jgi:hypothetical protein